MGRPVPIFHAVVTDDGERLVFELKERRQRKAHLRTLASKRVDVIVREHRSQRSLDQNNYWHAVPFPLLQEALGYDSIEELKHDLMGACWGWTRTKKGHEIPVRASTSGLNTEDGAHFTDWMVRFGATLPSPVIIPLPNEVAY